jgi:phytoene desaturase
MPRPHIAIIGGGLAGLSTGCYALRNGWDVTILEHNASLGGVCTAWKRGPYTIDGCIHWLTGGAFSKIYEELHIVPPVQIHVLDEFSTCRDVRAGKTVTFRRDLEAVRRELHAVGPEDVEEIDRMIDAAVRVADMSPGIDRPAEITTLREQLRALWEMRGELGTLVHFRSTVGDWTRTHLRSPVLREMLRQLVPAEGPMLFALMLLGYLGRGWLSRPMGGTAPFRDALIDRFTTLGGRARLSSTVEEVIVRDDVARGVRLADGTMIEADIVVSTASAPETVFQLVGGRYGAAELGRRLARWKMFDPIILASYGVAMSLADVPSTMVIGGLEPQELGGVDVDRLYVRVYNDDPSFAPAGHSVVQLMIGADYHWWATRGEGYTAAKDAVAELGIRLLEPFLPGIGSAVRMVDIATPLTFWRTARSWRGAFEGWMPSPESFTTHVSKTLPGLDGFFMAGQWVEPGGGVPTALMSGRQLVQILCHRAGRPFVID